MRALVLLNPAAQDGRAGRLRGQLAEALKAGGLDARIVATEGPGDAERLAREHAAGADMVLIAGGDGTIHEVVNGLVGSRTPFGVLPLGTGNDYALALGMPSDLRAAVEVASRVQPVPVDAGRVTWTECGPGGPSEVTRYFANSLGAGFDAHAARLASETKWLGGRTAYLAAVLRTLWAWRKPGVHVRATFERAAMPAEPGREAVPVTPARFEGPLFLCEVGNGHSVGGGFLLTPDARPDDGVLDVCLVRHLPVSRALRLLPRSFTGAHVGAAEVTMDRVVALEVDVDVGALALQADGEALTFSATGFRVEVVPGALSVLAPRLSDAT